MRVVGGFSELERGAPSIVTIGAFDGVHRGHQFLIRNVVSRALRSDSLAVIVTFDPRPLVVLRPQSTQLTSGKEKARIISALGPDVLVLLPFTKKTSETPAGTFLLELLEHVNVSEMWTGSDFAFGHNREGDVELLIRAGQQSGFGVHVVERQSLDGVALSSTAIRKLIAEGDVGSAAELLGHYFRLTGTVVSGAGRGAGFGVPTANLQTPEEQQLPGEGIYAGYLNASGAKHPAAVSVGRNLQFGGESLVVEAHAIDYEGDMRGQIISLDFVERLRDQQLFEAVDDLVRAMKNDVDQARNLLARSREPGELILSRDD